MSRYFPLLLLVAALSSCAAGTDNYENNKDPSALPEKPSNDDTKSKLDVAQRDFGGFSVITSRIESITQLKMSAEEGHAPSQHRLGDAYRLGQGLKKDFAVAVDWYRKAAEQNYRDAQYSLAVSYRKGIGVAKNPVEAVRWYKAAANHDHPQAQGTLGVMYINGEGVEPNYEEAASWFLRAAKQNDVQAQYFLGNMFIRGDGVPQDKQRGYFWLRIAQAQGADQALPTLAQLENELSKEELARLKKELLDLGIGNSR